MPPTAATTPTHDAKGIESTSLWCEVKRRTSSDFWESNHRSFRGDDNVRTDDDFCPTAQRMPIHRYNHRLPATTSRDIPESILPLQ
jgi:hypothetical protein